MTDAEKLKKLVDSPILYIENFMKVVDKSGKLVKFKLNPEQRYLLQNMDKYNICLKSRQLGITTLSCSISIYLASTNSNTVCLIMSHSMESASAIFEKLKQLYNDLPDALKVPLIANNKKELKFLNGSRIICSTCGNKDVSRGATISFAHISEVGFCKDTIKKQLLAIEQALTPNGKIILESTANGLNYFSELWGKAERKENMYKPFFFPWQEDHEMFKDEYKIFCDRYIDIHGALPTVDELDDTEKQLYTQGTSLQQLVWRKMKIANSSEEAFAQEFPSNPTEAFISTGSNVFSPKLIHERMQYINEVKAINKPTKLPASLVQWFNHGLTMWNTPKNEQKYYIGVDTGEGLGQDYSAIEILDTDGKQVCEFKSNKVKPFQFAELANDIGIYFNKALLVVEKMSAGHSVVDKLRHDYKYQNMYKYKEYDQRTGLAKKKVGYVTNPKSKSILINDYIELFEKNQIVINSKDLLNEMKMFQSIDGKMGAMTGYHDDLCMAFGMAIVGIKSGINYI